MVMTTDIGIRLEKTDKDKLQKIAEKKDVKPSKLGRDYIKVGIKKDEFELEKD